MKGVEGPTRGVLEEEGWLVTDLLGFEGPLCGLLQQGGPLHKKKKREGGLEGRCLVHWPLQQGAWAGRQLTRSSPTYQMFLVRELLAFNKLSYCKSVIRQGKHGHPTSTTTHTSEIF